MSFLAFLFAATVLAITPGPGIAYVVARTVAGGRSEGLASCLGTGIGGMLHVLAAALGISLLVAQSALAFNLVKYLGAAYLVYLGIRMLLRKDHALTVKRVAPQGARHALLEGIAVEALNVKTALFFLAFLPQFVSSAEPLVPQLVLRGPQHDRRRRGSLRGRSSAQVADRSSGTCAAPYSGLGCHYGQSGRLSCTRQA
jgi:threonine/homoserine/homoserine lactone efflux protein